jgi:glycosyltransferase involved in cell wall biosynthesis
LDWSTKFAARHAAHLFVPSASTKRDLQEFYRVPESRITVTPLAPDHDRFDRLTEGDVERVRQKYQLSPSYFLTVSRLEEKKNIVNLIRAFELFKSRRGLGDPFQLLLVGKPGFGYEKIKSFLASSSSSSLKGGSDNSIRELGWVNEDEVPALMKGALAYVYPSWYEGFGISAVEAMAAGTALIVSDLPVMHEVAEEAAWYAHPDEPEAFASLFARVIDQPVSREQLIEAGKLRVRDFQWQETAGKTLEVLRECDIPAGIVKTKF